MQDNDVTPILLERAVEQLRQEREIFQQRKLQEARWFSLRLVMGYASVILLVGIMAVASYILVNSNLFPASVVVSAGGALFADVLGLLIAVWKIVLNPSSITKLTPATEIPLADLKAIGRAGAKDTKPIPKARAAESSES